MRLSRLVPASLSLHLALVAGLVYASDTSSDPTRLFPRAEVDAAFARGAPLLETGSYKIHASRRTTPGQAEIHVRDTDLVYVLSGSATLVTGGSVPDAKESAPDELRGSAIAGGNPRRIGPGDVVVVPSGTPHWFREVEGPVLYYVVKVTDGGAR